MDNLVLRQAAPRDSEFAYTTKKAAFRKYVEKVWGWNEEEQRQLHERRFKEQDVRIINLGGKDIGILALLIAPGCVNVNQLFILPEYQGRGIGRRCMSLVMEEAQQLGLPVRLRVLKVNLRALKFFERIGFKQTGETDTHHLMQ